MLSCHCGLIFFALFGLACLGAAAEGDGAVLEYHLVDAVPELCGKNKEAEGFVRLLCDLAWWSWCILDFVSGGVRLYRRCYVCLHVGRAILSACCALTLEDDGWHVRC